MAFYNEKFTTRSWWPSRGQVPPWTERHILSLPKTTPETGLDKTFRRQKWCQGKECFYRRWVGRARRNHFCFFCKKDHFNKLETCKFQAHFFLKLQPAFHKQKASAHAANFTCCTTAVTQSPSPSPTSLMLQKSGENSSVEVGSEYPIIYRVWAPSQGVIHPRWLALGFLNHKHEQTMAPLEEFQYWVPKFRLKIDTWATKKTLLVGL